MAGVARPLTRTERRLHDRVRSLLPPDETLHAALFAYQLPSDGTAKKVAKGCVAALAGMHPSLWGKPCTIAVTDRGVVRFRHRQIGRSPAAIAERYALADLGPFETTGLEFWFDLAGHRYSVPNDWNSEHVKMRRLREQLPE